MSHCVGLELRLISLSFSGSLPRPNMYLPSPFVAGRSPSFKRLCCLLLSCYHQAPRPLSLSFGCPKGVATPSTWHKRLPRLRLNCFTCSSPKSMVMSFVRLLSFACPMTFLTLFLACLFLLTTFRTELEKLDYIGACGASLVERLDNGSCCI